MFIISIDGGLGNQMFEYAFYLSVKHHYCDQEVYFDTSLLKDGVHNGYELEQVFGVKVPMADPEDVARYSEYCPMGVKNSRWINWQNRVRRNFIGRKKSYIVQKDSSAYDKSIYCLNSEGSYYMRGVWANVKYFEELEENILQAFIFPVIVDEKNTIWKQKILNSNAVAVHFRKGDYVQFGFEVLSRDYYVKAMNYMDRHVQNPRYFVFADDMAGAREAIGTGDHIVYVEGNHGNNAYVDMQLMSLCKHNIIANSTFSFWGAYLNRNAEKNVVYPIKPLKGCKYAYADKTWIGM